MNCKCNPVVAPLLLVAGALVALSGPASAKSTLDAPTLTCGVSTASSITLNVCAGASGAPAGFSVQWETLADYTANGWSDVNATYCAASFSGVPACSRFDLAPNGCAQVTAPADINECGASTNAGCDINLLCGTQYVFRVFAHAEQGADGSGRSDFSANTTCSTAPCNPGDCTFTWGYWKTHGPAGCDPSGNQGNLWPAGYQSVGCLGLTQDQLCAILQQNPSACGKGTGANAVLILEHQLIAAELNRGAGLLLPCPFAEEAIANANALLCGNEYACVGTSSTLGQQMLEVKDRLEAYNSDQCSCPAGKPLAAPVGNTRTPGKAAPAKGMTWGEVKVIYR